MINITRRQFLRMVGKTALGLSLGGAVSGALSRPALAKQYAADTIEGQLMAGWKGNWIWCSGEERPKNSYMYARKVIDLPAKPGKAIARMCADSRYKLFVNGKLIGRGPTRSFPEYQHYDEYNLAKSLKKGKNVIAALIHHYGEPTFMYNLGRGGFLFDSELEIGGKKIGLATDNSWKVLLSKGWHRDLPRMDIQLEFNEIYDANKAPWGWANADFDDSAWEDASVIGPVGTPPWKLIPRTIPFLMEYQIYPAKVLETGAGDISAVQMPDDDKLNVAKLQQSETCEKGAKGLFTNANSFARRPQIDDLLSSSVLWPDGEPEKLMVARCDEANAGLRNIVIKPSPDGRSSYVVLDFGREVMGYVNFKIQSNSGGTVDMGYSETMENGRVVANRRNVRYADRVVLRPGEMDYETFDKRGFRYMQIDFRDLNGPVVFESVGVRFSTYPVQWRGSFECSDQKLNDIRQICTYTVQLNMEDAYTDCPWRERAQWWGDARVEAMINYYAFGDTQLMRQGLQEIARSQHEDGITNCFAPGTLTTCDPIPSFCLIWILSIWDYYIYTGDKSAIAELYPNVKKALDGFFLSRINNMGLLSNVPYWMFIDWAPMELKGAVASLNCLLVAALRTAADMAKIDKKPQDVEKYLIEANKLSAAINEHLVDPQKGVYADCYADGKRSAVISEQTNSLAVLFDIAPPEKRQMVLDYIHSDKNQVVRAGSPYFSFYVLHALWHTGNKKRGIDYIRKHWGDMAASGATTAWEMWNPSHSLCHGWSGGPAMDLPAQILGIRPLGPGFRKFEVAPETFNLRWAEAVVPSVRGDIEAYWKREDGFTMGVTVPRGAEAIITLPDRVDAGIVSVNGHKKLPEGVQAKPSTDGKPVYAVKGPYCVTFCYNKG